MTDKLVEHFLEIVNVNFTAKMEEELDRIAEGGPPASAYSASSGSRSGRTSSAEEKFERYEEVDETAHGASRRAGRPRAGP